MTSDHLFYLIVGMLLGYFFIAPLFNDNKRIECFYELGSYVVVGEYNEVNRCVPKKY